jgi:antirestriction protein ArdC
MAKTSNPHRADERKAQAEALHATLIEQVQQLSDSGQWQAFLDFAKSFHHYSLNNLLLILAQKPDATMIAGFRQWQAKGRQVRKGEKSIKIFGYNTKKANTDEDMISSEESERTVRYFPILSVFDTSQTDPIDGTVPINPIQQLIGGNDHGVLVPLTAHLASNGWTLSRPTPHQANGYTDPERHTIALSSQLAPEQSAKTLIHEAAHVHLGHVDNIDNYRQHRGRMEVEAESVAYIVAGLTGFDTSAYSIGYVTGWSNQNIELIRETARRVLQAAHTIADAIAA